MTRGNKFLTLFLLQVGLLGGAAVAGAHYWHEYKFKKPMEECRVGWAASAKQAELMAARGFLMEAEVGILISNYGYSFERVVQARMASQLAGLKLEKDFDQIQGLLISQNPAVRTQVYDLANKIMPVPYGNNPGSAKSDGGAEAATGGAAAAVGGGGPRAPGGAGAPGAGAAGGAGGGGGNSGAATGPGSTAETQAPLASGAAGDAASAKSSPITLPGAGVGPKAAVASDTGLQAGRKALLDAKVSLISGGETAATARQIALARVTLDEAGRADLDDELDSAIDAAHHHDENKAKAALESVLKKLRAP